MNRTINDLSYTEMVDMLDAELTAVAAILKDLSDEEWIRTSPLRPVDEAVPHWTVREIASHFDISIGLTLALIEGRTMSSPPATAPASSSTRAVRPRRSSMSTPT